jgi:hypothetical protein
VHFDVELLTDRGSGMISSWLFEHVGRRSIERILVDHQDIKLDVDRLRDALDRSR